MFRILIFLSILLIAYCSSKDKPHGHQGILEPYTGKPLPVQLSSGQRSKLDKGDSVLYNERSGSSGCGVVIQDVNASTSITMEKIRDLEHYNKMVPHVKKVEIYESNKFMNGTSKTGAKFDIGLMGMRFGYFLMLTHEPKYNTLTWTLDYKYNSDFDDNCGHWQVMPHPTKKGWTRVLYSCKIKLFNWIPEFIIKFLTSKALTESTDWVKRESEAEQAKQAELNKNKGSGWGSGGGWLNMKGGFDSFKDKIDAKLDAAQQQLQTQRQRMSARIGVPKFGFIKK